MPFSNLKNRFKNSPPVTYWWVTAAIFVLYMLYLPATPYSDLPFDAAGYWETSETFLQNNTISLYHFTAVLRGIVLPLMLFPVYLISDNAGIAPIVLTRMLGALQAAFLFGLILPKLWEAASESGSLSWQRRGLFALTGFALWRDYFNFPLSDFPALLCIAGCLLLLFRRTGFAGVVVAGILLAAGINIRPVYMVLVPVALAAIWLVHPERHSVKAGIRIFIFAAGFFIACMPQFLINVKHYQYYSLFSASDYEGKSLYLSQLNWGIITQKYETNFGQEYKTAAMNFNDTAGLAIKKAENFEELASYGEYTDLVLKYPVDFAGIYFRHFFNGLDLQYPSPYPLWAMKIHWPVLLLNYTLLFAAFTTLLLRNQWRLNRKKIITLLAVALPCLVVIPTAIEPRFFLPLHLFIYALVCFSFPVNRKWRDVPVFFKIKAAVLYLFFLTGCFTMSANTQTQLEFQPRLFRESENAVVKEAPSDGWK